MIIVSPARPLGTTIVRAGSVGLASPDMVIPGFGRLVAVSLSETCDPADLRLNASPPPDTTGWMRCRLRKDIAFPIDERTRGRVSSAPTGPSVVEFDFAWLFVPEGEFEIVR